MGLPPGESPEVSQARAWGDISLERTQPAPHILPSPPGPEKDTPGVIPHSPPLRSIYPHPPTPMGRYLSSPLGAVLPPALPPGLGNFLEMRPHENKHLLTASGQTECVGVFISIFISFFFFFFLVFYKIQQHMVGEGEDAPGREVRFYEV